MMAFSFNGVSNLICLCLFITTSSFNFAFAQEVECSTLLTKEECEEASPWDCYWADGIRKYGKPETIITGCKPRPTLANGGCICGVTAIGGGPDCNAELDDNGCEPKKYCYMDGVKNFCQPIVPGESEDCYFDGSRDEALCVPSWTCKRRAIVQLRECEYTEISEIEPTPRPTVPPPPSTEPTSSPTEPTAGPFNPTIARAPTRANSPTENPIVIAGGIVGGVVVVAILCMYTRRVKKPRKETKGFQIDSKVAKIINSGKHGPDNPVSQGLRLELVQAKENEMVAESNLEPPPGTDIEKPQF